MYKIHELIPIDPQQRQSPVRLKQRATCLLFAAGLVVTTTHATADNQSPAISNASIGVLTQQPQLPLQTPSNSIREFIVIEQGVPLGRTKEHDQVCSTSTITIAQHFRYLTSSPMHAPIQLACSKT